MSPNGFSTISHTSRGAGGEIKWIVGSGLVFCLDSCSFLSSRPPTCFHVQHMVCVCVQLGEINHVNNVTCACTYSCSVPPLLLAIGRARTVPAIFPLHNMRHGRVPLSRLGPLPIRSSLSRDPDPKTELRLMRCDRHKWIMRAIRLHFDIYSFHLFLIYPIVAALFMKRRKKLVQLLRMRGEWCMIWRWEGGVE
jgi:hypothetical protein